MGITIDKQIVGSTLYRVNYDIPYESLDYLEATENPLSISGYVRYMEGKFGNATMNNWTLDVSGTINVQLRNKFYKLSKITNLAEHMALTIRIVTVMRIMLKKYNSLELTTYQVLCKNKSNMSNVVSIVSSDSEVDMSEHPYLKEFRKANVTDVDVCYVSNKKGYPLFETYLLFEIEGATIQRGKIQLPTFNYATIFETAEDYIFEDPISVHVIPVDFDFYLKD